jgi:cyanophycinase
MTMAGYLLLEGGAEFGGRMAEPDRRAIELAGGPNALIAIIPTAAAPDNNYQRAGNNGVRWFQSLGATHVTSLPVIDKASANDPRIAAEIGQAGLIYMLGGFTGYLGETITGSASWDAMLKAYESGSVIAGSSAGAMVMCQYYFDPGKGHVVEGLGLLPNTCVLPHHNTFGKGWAARLTNLLPNALLLGIDEQTGMLDDGQEGKKADWRVYGKGAVTLYRNGHSTVYRSGSTFKEDFSVI